MPASFDESQLPLLRITINGLMTSPEFDEYLARYATYLTRSPLVCLHDARSAGIPALDQQRSQGIWIRDQRELIRTNCAGIAFVVESAPMRFMLSAIFLVARIPCPYIVSHDIAASEEWCRKRLREIGAQRAIPQSG